MEADATVPALVGEPADELDGAAEEAGGWSLEEPAEVPGELFFELDEHAATAIVLSPAAEAVRTVRRDIELVIDPPESRACE